MKGEARPRPPSPRSRSHPASWPEAHVLAEEQNPATGVAGFLTLLIRRLIRSTSVSDRLTRMCSLHACQVPGTEWRIGVNGSCPGGRVFGVNAVVPSVQRSSPGSQDKDKTPIPAIERQDQRKALPQGHMCGLGAAPAATNSWGGRLPAEHRGPPKLQAQANP